MPVLKSILLSLSRNRRLRQILETSRLGHRLSSRFVAGISLEEALAAVAGVNAQGMAATLDHLGENVERLEQAEAAADAAAASLNAIAARGLHCNLSLKLTQLGLDLGEAVAARLLLQVASVAYRHGNGVRVDMESSAYTDATLRIVEQTHAQGFPVGGVLQASLYRSAADLQRLREKGITVRLVKGAYLEPASLAWPRKPDVDASFDQLMEQMLQPGGSMPAGPLRHALATHDPQRLQRAQMFATAMGIGPRQLEFQMLYGIRRDLQRELAEAGWPVRIYIPYGAEWFPYFMRRLAERPANLLFLMRNLFTA